MQNKKKYLRRNFFNYALHDKKKIHVALARNETRLITYGTNQTNNAKYSVFVFKRSWKSSFSTVSSYFA